MAMIKDTSAQDVQVAPVSKLKKRLTVGLTVSVVLAAAIWFAAPGFSSLYSSDFTISKERLRFASVVRGDLQRDLAVQGKIVAAVSPTLFSASSGTVSLNVKAGDTVAEGQVLATIESPELNNLYSQELSRQQELLVDVGRQKIETKAALLDNRQRTELANVDLEVATTKNVRAEASIKNALISKEKYEEDKVLLKKAKLQYNHALQNEQLQKEKLEFELSAKNLQLERQQFVVDDLKRQIEGLNLRSPLNGVIGAINIKDKESVAKNQSLISVVDLTAFEIEVNIPESYADDLGVGLATEISFNGEKHMGELTAISPEVISGQVAGRVKFANQTPTGLRQNQRVSARVLIESRNNVLKVRRGAFVESGGGLLAYVVNDKSASKTPIQVGAKSMGEVEIISGLKEGDKIIISSFNEYSDKEQLYISQ
jgi:HlyD family secretion protein